MADKPNPVMLAVGWLVTVLGALWTLLAGVCTLYFVGDSVGSMARGGSDNGILGVALLFGAIGIVPGALILWGGIAILRSERRRAPAH